MISSFRNNVGRIIDYCVRNSSMQREAKKFQKMIDKINRKKTSNHSGLLIKSSGGSSYSNEGQSRRLISLNKAYMEEITGMLNGGKYRSQLNDVGVSITKVKMAKGLNFLSIYYTTERTDVEEEELNFVLSKALGELQQEIGSVRYTSKIPLLRFIRDKKLESGKELEKIFEDSEFYKDFEPVHNRKVTTPDFVQPPDDIPQMRQNVLGLDHFKLVKNIEDKILKYKAINIEQEPEGKEEEPQVPEKLIVFNKEEYYKFYKRRRILELKMRKKLYKKEDGFEGVFVPEEVDYEEDDKFEFEEFNENFNEK